MAEDSLSVSVEQPAKKAYTTKTLTMHLWSIGAIAEFMLYVPFGFLVQPIFMLEFQLNPILIGWAQALPRLVDGFLDPVWGHWSDTSRSRWGRRRPFILASSFIGAFIIAGMWWASPTWSQKALFVWVLLANFLVFTFYGIFSTTHLALGYELSDDFNERARVLAIRGFYGSVPGLISLYWLAQWLAHPQTKIRWLDQCFARHENWFGNPINGIRWVGALMGLCAMIAGLIPVLACRERFKWAAQRKHVNLWQAFKATIRVRAFVVVLLLQFAQTLGGMLWQQISFYILVFSLCAGMRDPKQAASWLGMPGSWLGFGWGFVMMFLAAPICKVIGKRGGIILNYGIGALNALLLPFFMRPGYYWVYLGFTLAFIPLQGIGGTFMNAVMPDICDIDELESGERREGLFIAVLNWMSKLQNSIITVIAGYLLVWIGFNQKLDVQPPEVVSRLRFWGMGMMIVGTVLAFAISWMMPITAKQMAEVRAKLDERHRRLAAEAAERERQGGPPVAEEGLEKAGADA
jgi:GPH family glycoside/pentoside/hexuronide:cation symporter